MIKFFIVILLITKSFSYNNYTDDSNVDEIIYQDPLKTYNKFMFKFNHVIDELFFTPISGIYSNLVPNVIQKRTRNIIKNIYEPLYFLQFTLQGNLKSAGKSILRFLINSTLGILGLFDVAEKANLYQETNDFGITLAKYGAKSGPYIILPFIGPTTGRDFIGTICDTFTLNPLLYHKTTNSILIHSLVLDIIISRANANASLNLIYQSHNPYDKMKATFMLRREQIIEEYLESYED